MEKLGSAIAPLLLRNLLTSISIHAYKTLIYISKQHKLLQTLHSILVAFFLFILNFLPSQNHPPFKPTSKDDKYLSSSRDGGSGVARALSQLLQIMNDIPVSSRKYEVVRSLVEKLIDENNMLLDDTTTTTNNNSQVSLRPPKNNNTRVLRDINCSVLSAAFERSLSQLEAAVGRRSDGDVGESDSYGCDKVSRLMSYGRAAWRYAKSNSETSRSGVSAEKLAAEVLWLAQKMAASGCAEEAVCKWAEAEKLAWLALSAEPRLQGSLVKVSAFLIKELAKEMHNQEYYDEHSTYIKMKILVSWLPLLCRANNGTDAPILNTAERAELERILEEIISTLEEDDEQERVLSIWLHHFTYCPASDWPNLRSCYTRWFDASRDRLLLAVDASIN